MTRGVCDMGLAVNKTIANNLQAFLWELSMVWISVLTTASETVFYYVYKWGYIEYLLHNGSNPAPGWDTVQIHSHWVMPYPLYLGWMVADVHILPGLSNLRYEKVVVIGSLLTGDWLTFVMLWIECRNSFIRGKDSTNWTILFSLHVYLSKTKSRKKYKFGHRPSSSHFKNFISSRLKPNLFWTNRAMYFRVLTCFLASFIFCSMVLNKWCNLTCLLVIIFSIVAPGFSCLVTKILFYVILLT